MLKVESVKYCGGWSEEIGLIIFLGLSPWVRATRNQTTANRNQEKKNDAAKLRMVQCQGAPIIDVKKSFKYLVEIFWKLSTYICKKQFKNL